jgi:hypothetical protein
MAIGKHNDYCEHGMIGLVFIEPELPPSQPLLDELTDRVNKLVEKHIKPDTNWGNSWRGVHTCSCGVRSDNYDHYFIHPGKTNKLTLLIPCWCITAAGFCSRGQDGKFSVWGRSVGLKVGSRPEDVEILNNLLEREG